MRLYTFTNFYLSSIQQGIQPAHVLGELFVKYRDAGIARDVLFDWARNHKTMICLNGGTRGSIIGINAQLNLISDALNLPTAAFHEDNESLGGIITSVGIVVPTDIYERAAEMRANRTPIEETGVTSDPELQLIDLLNGYNLAK